VPTVTFDDIGGLDTVKQRLTELVTYPQQYDELYAQSSLTPANGVLLCGPPGTGKTLLAKALATETDRAFYSVDGAEIKSKWFGQSEQRLRGLFATARDTAPSIIFFDEFDALAGTRHDATHSTVQSIVNTLLAELDGITENDELLVVAATNYPDAIDPAITRPGRLGETLDVPEPDDAAIREIFQIHTRNLPTANNVTPAWFATTAPDGTTGATIANLTEQALHHAIRDVDSDSESDTPTITRHHLHHAITQATSRNDEVDYGYQ
jgi:transitional endoplasmic reticulum ATPase